MPLAASKKYCDMIEEALEDEEKGVKFYEKLSKGDFTLPDRGIIVGIQREEKVHVAQLRRIKMASCGGVRAMKKGRHTRGT